MNVLTRTTTIALGSAILLFSVAVVPLEMRRIGARYPDGIIVPSGQLLAPAGKRIEYPGRPLDIAVAPDQSTLAVLFFGRGVLLLTPSGEQIKQFTLPAPTAYGGVVFTPDGKSIAATYKDGISIMPVVAGGRSMQVGMPANSTPSGLAFDGSGNLYVALNQSNQLVRIAPGGAQMDSLKVGVAPISVAVANPAGRVFVTNWGGHIPTPGSRTASSANTPVVVDERGIASDGSVSVIDLKTFHVEAEITVGRHPGNIRVRPDGAIAAIADANGDTVTILDTRTLAVLDTVEIPAFPIGHRGASPAGLAFSPDGQRLYVACSGNNAVAVLEPANGHYGLKGSFPADWYPVALAAANTASGEVLFTANLKGIGSPSGVKPPFNVHMSSGSLNILPASAMRLSDDLVAHLNQPFVEALALRRPTQPPTRGDALQLSRLGVSHVFLIIKENRTYDQVLGDLGTGDGDPSLAIFGSAVTPNQHSLAKQFVTLDNFYATGVTSPEGHTWLTQATTSDYVERSAAAGWPRSYPASGEDPLMFADTGFIWDDAIAHGATVRIFGEFTVAATNHGGSWNSYLKDADAHPMQLSPRSKSPVQPLNALIEPTYPTFALNIPDQFRARIFLDRFNEMIAGGSVPNLVIIHLPTDHTSGTLPGLPTPVSMVADNDLAVGRIVAAISQSPYWSSSAIFINEDDAQDGVDHVDGHRTMCLVASPFVKRFAVDSRQYNQTSLVRTIEELLGLPPMNKFDAAAIPMTSIFQSKADLTPFRFVPNQTPLDQMNPPLAGLNGSARRAALDSLDMNLTVADAAPEGKLNRIIWQSIRGWNTPYPKVPHKSTCPDDDDDK